MGKDKLGIIKIENLQKILDEETGKEKTKVTNGDKGIIVEFTTSHRTYEINENGKITKVEIYVDTTPGELAAEIQKDENGNYITVYKIESIEDLVVFSIMTSGGDAELGIEEKYYFENEKVILARTLDFNSTQSYVESTTTKYNNYLKLEEDIPLIEALTNNEYNGFIPIGSSVAGFHGIFDGQNYSIENIYVNRDGEVGLFSCASGTIENISVSGNIISKDIANAGGILATNHNDKINIYNCHNKAQISGGNTGGILASTSESVAIINCSNIGNINGKWRYGSGGIVGAAMNNKRATEKSIEIYNSYNIGNITLENGAAYCGVGGILGRQFHRDSQSAINITINNCYSTGNIEKGWNCGGIIGTIETIEQTSIDNCYYLSTTENNITKGIGNQETDTCIQYKETQMKSQEYLLKNLEEYITNNKEKTTKWRNWKQGENGLPIFE